ncbi:PepSY domain-containing protein [Methylocystis sp. MJC1]|uniref:PepSY domain-containing protein n=1 Tax=Methylocystis sp. MJC1 TaxID=2654282 RepID=UPI0013ECEE27|nr:PepSY domain-containing protein [Methylocystis sp. MJC1]KAF2991218.1 hypothetical protein MJC1_01567 [Methylocystis sp. MJC1]MBU6526242.1 PepSY domain-containing protein [Methylocystis sp. MJC1]UZX12696.1 PepSY domain-containing protein [Methylocystis sp. MJC1]
MAFLDTMFRRRGADGADVTRDASPVTKRLQHATKKVQPGGSKVYRWSFVIHKWTGLAGAGWLAALGLTGFFLDHDSWRWQMQAKTPSWLTTRALDEQSARNTIRYLQIDPADNAHRVAGGPRGVWVSRDSGATWTPTVFQKGDHPQLLAIEPDGAKGWERLWLATDDGVYLSEDGGASARLAALEGNYVTGLAADATPRNMLAIVDRAKVYRFDADAPGKIEPIEFAPLEKAARPLDAPLNRFVHDLHFGRALAGPTTSLVANDIGGIGMFVLSITGLLYWGLPKWWKAQGKRQGRTATTTRTSKEAKKTTIIWLFRLHSVTLGIASVVMMLYLSITGVFLGHGRELFMWMRSVKIPQAYLTPAFALSSWDGWIDSIVAYPDMPGACTIGNRIGMFTTVDGGQTWAREDNPSGEPVRLAARMRRFGDRIVMVNGMGGASAIRGSDGVNREVKASPMGMGMEGGHGGVNHGATGGGEQSLSRRAQLAGMGMGGMENMFMPSDVAMADDKLLWKSSDKLWITDREGKSLGKQDINMPSDPGTPWFTWFLRLHVGTIFWSEWKWVNDVFAVLAVFLSVTGLIRWWRKKWA